VCTSLLLPTLLHHQSAIKKGRITGEGLRRNGSAHPADVLELLGADIVSMHDEGLLVGVEKPTELLIVLSNNTKLVKTRSTCPHSDHPI
jgi:hypothetical protein